MMVVYKAVSNYEIERTVLVHPTKMCAELGEYVRKRDYDNLQAENARLKAERADSLPLQKVREMVEYCRKDNHTVSCDGICPHKELCYSLNNGIEIIWDLIDYERLEAYVKEVRGE